MAPGPAPLQASVEARLWPRVEALVRSHGLAGLAVAVVRDDEVVTRGFGVRDLRTGAPVTPETMFHLASVSKPVVATAICSLATTVDGSTPRLDLDAPVVELVPELTLADGRQAEVTARGLLSHTSGLPDVSEYGWHDPQLGDDALAQFVRSMSGWRLQSDPGSTFSYSNSGYELLGLLLSRVLATTFEDAVDRQVMAPLGMERSTFLRADVPTELAASPHVGMPLSVPGEAYPYTRRHAPSSTLHSNLVELCRWMDALLGAADGSAEPAGPVDRRLLDLMWRPVAAVGEPPWEDEAAMGWFVGSYRGHRVVDHTGADPGFGSRLVLVPDRRTGVVVLANSNTVPTSVIASAALDLALADVGEDGLEELAGLLPPVVGPVADVLATSGRAAATEAYERLAAGEPPEVDLDDEGFEHAVWGAIELHRTDLVRPILEVWTEVRPESSAAWTMTGWAHQVDGDLDVARTLLRKVIDLDPDNADAALILGESR